MRRQRTRRLAFGLGGLGLAATALAGPAVLPGASAGPSTQGGFTSDNVKHLKFIPFEVGTATGARVIGHYLFVTSWKNISIYDIKDPLNPVNVSITPIQPMFENEDVSTNGKILLFSESVPTDNLHVWDLQDYAHPNEIATLPGAGDHTTSCLFDCRYGWGSSGTVTDLRRVDQPKIIGNWSQGLPGKSVHDVTELTPGMVLTASQPFMLLDATKSVTHPKLIATGSSPDKRFIHSVLWPRQGKDKFLLIGGETNFNPRCNTTTESAHFMVWKAGDYKKTHKFEQTDQYTYKNGVYADGNPAVNGMGCSSHWFNPQPDFKDGGIVAVASYEHGTKFFMVDRKGKLHEAGYFEPFPGAESAAYWITKKLVYTIDYQRGFDILEYNGPTKPEQLGK